MINSDKEYSSFRDPSGFIFKKDGQLYRQINYTYKNDYDFFIKSGLYQELARKKYIVPFQEVKKNGKGYYRIIKPQQVDFISYPYEWCFSEYKAAALSTLDIQKIALKKGMCLKDASAYNIQFQDNEPIHIDTLSFEIMDVEKPWKAYKQFCQHFLAPLALMSYVHTDLNNMMRNYIDGIPLEVASKLLPKFKSWGVWVNIHLNSFFSNKYCETCFSTGTLKGMSLQKHLVLIDGLYNTISKMTLTHSSTEWAKYYDNTNYSVDGFKTKEKIITDIISKIPNKTTLWDFGANNGYFTRIASKHGIKAISFDIDINATEANYNYYKKHKKEKSPFPLMLDLTNPSPNIGWNNLERNGIFKRSKVDTIMALALIHHLVISNNIPFEYIASCFSNLAPQLIIEFVDKEDSQVQKLLCSRTDIFLDYNEKKFENTFSKYYSKFQKYPIPETKRIIYFFQK